MGMAVTDGDHDDGVQGVAVLDVHIVLVFDRVPDARVSALFGLGILRLFKAAAAAVG